MVSSTAKHITYPLWDSLAYSQGQPCPIPQGGSWGLNPQWAGYSVAWLWGVLSPVTKGESQKQLRRVGTALLVLLTHARANINASFWEWISLPELLPLTPSSWDGLLLWCQLESHKQWKEENKKACTLKTLQLLCFTQRGATGVASASVPKYKQNGKWTHTSFVL